MRPIAQWRTMVLVVPILLVAVVVSGYDDSTEFKVEVDESKLLAKSLRHKLMQENYDYSHEDINNTVIENVNKHVRRKKKTRKNFYVSDLTVNENNRKENIASEANENEKNHEKNVERVVAKKDLMYYIDDDHFDREKPVTESTVKYKLLKDRRQYRRSGQARLIQEENKEGVAIVNLDKGPFPELRLPNSRRQYMHDRGDAQTDDEEVPPPTVDTSDPEAAVDDTDHQTETEVSVATTDSF